jgi:hypothetical protein
VVQGFASLQSAATVQGWQPAIGVWVQPLKALQESIVHALPSLQSRVAPAVHTPAWHVSAPLHTVPSAHDVPFVTARFTQPEAALQLSDVQTLPSLQLSGVPAVQTPPWQVSAPLHTVASAHAVPLGRAVVKHPMIGSQLSVVQVLPSLQTGGVPAVQEPLWQVSSPLQRLPSAQDTPLASVGLLHTPAVQMSLVHGFPSAQSAFTMHEAQPAIGVF